MNSTLKTALALLAVVGLVIGCGPATSSPAATTSATRAPGAATPTAPPSASAAAIAEFPGYSDDVAPGTYKWSAGSATPADITFTLPAGWSSRFGIPHKDRGGSGEIAFGNWIIANVYSDPCRWDGSLLDPAVGPTIDDLAGALAAQKGRNATAPTDVALGGYLARRVELSIPADLDRATCDGGVIRTWKAAGEDPVLEGNAENLGMHPGQLNEVYIVDVDGARLVIDTWHMPGTPVADLAELDAILAGLRIEA